MEALEALRTNGAGTFQLVLTVSHVICFGLFDMASAGAFRLSMLLPVGRNDARRGRNRASEARSTG